MASHAPDACCTVGVKHSGTPAGSSITIDDSTGGSIDAYLATPPAGAGAHQGVGLLYLPDVIGIWQNSQLMADQLAANGYTTLVLDLYNRDPLPLNRPDSFVFADWMAKGSAGNNPHTPPHVDPIVVAAIKHMRDALGCGRIGALGYCFGAKYVARHYRSGISVGYFAHPSFVDEDELLGITGPLSIAAAETDDIFTVDKRHRSEALLASTGQPWQINLFSAVSHGFSVRGDVSKPHVRFAKEQAFLQAVAWFDQYLL